MPPRAPFPLTALLPRAHVSAGEGKGDPALRQTNNSWFVANCKLETATSRLAGPATSSTVLRQQLARCSTASRRRGSINPGDPVAAPGEKVQDAAMAGKVEGADGDEGATFGEPSCHAFNHAQIALVDLCTA